MSTVRLIARNRLERAVIDRLSEIHDPCSVRNRTPLTLTEMGIIEDVTAGADGDVTITLLLTDPSCVFFFDIGRSIEDALADIPGVRDVSLVNIGDRWWEESERMSSAARAKLAGMRRARDARVRA